jgi:hypothetical protein
LRWGGVAAGCFPEAGHRRTREAAFEIVADTNREVIDRIFVDVREARYAGRCGIAHRQRTCKLNSSQEIAVGDLIARLEKQTQDHGPRTTDQ